MIQYSTVLNEHDSFLALQRFILDLVLISSKISPKSECCNEDSAASTVIAIFFFSWGGGLRLHRRQISSWRTRTVRVRPDLLQPCPAFYSML